MRIDSLPAEWTAVLTQGNQTFTDGELFATSHRGILQDVYLYKGGTLTKYLAQPTTGLYSASNHTSLPSTSIQTVSQGVPTIISFPPLKKLRRVHFQDLNNDMSTVRIFSFMLPPHPRSNPTTFFGGVLIGSYSHPSIPTKGDISYSVVARAWRLLQAPSRHQDVAAMSQLAFGDPDKDLSSLTRNIQKLFISPTMCHFLWRLLNNSLYSGQRARDYQQNIKHVPLGDPCLVPGNCLYLGHSFNPGFHPTFSPHKPVTVTSNSYAHCLQNSPMALSLWAQTTNLLQDMGIQFPLTNWHSIFQCILDCDLTCETSMVTVNTCIVLLYTLYSLDKELTDKHTTNPDLLTDTLIDRWLVHGASTLHHNLAMQALTFPQLLHQLRIKETVPSGKGKRAQVWNVRQQALFPPSPYNAFNLSDALVASLQDLWLRTNLVELVEHTNKQLEHSGIRLKMSRRVDLTCFDGKSARRGMASCHITVISPSDTA